MFSLEDLAESIIKSHPLVPEGKGTTDSELFDLLTSLGISDTELIVLLDELLINAREHGSAPIRIFSGVYLGNFYFAIWDQGMGIHSTLPNNQFLSDIKNKSASALIRLSCEEGITGTGVLGRGVGLFLLSSFCMKRREECLLLSDGGFLLQVQDRFMEKPHPMITGTLICLKVKT